MVAKLATDRRVAKSSLGGKYLNSKVTRSAMYSKTLAKRSGDEQDGDLYFRSRGIAFAGARLALVCVNENRVWMERSGVFVSRARVTRYEREKAGGVRRGR